PERCTKATAGCGPRVFGKRREPFRVLSPLRNETSCCVKAGCAGPSASTAMANQGSTQAVTPADSDHKRNEIMCLQLTRFAALLAGPASLPPVRECEYSAAKWAERGPESRQRRSAAYS